tara:strand:+ start:2470 stop:4098 length:1629 start_codon:yes stop_codon:yes gene_type:complete
MKESGDFGKERRSRRFHFIAQAALMVGLAIGANFLASRFFGRWDLALPENYTLSAETKKVLEKLEKPIDVIVTIPDNVNPDQSRLLKRLLLDLKFLLASIEEKSSTKGKVRAHYVNVFKRQGANEEIVAKYELREQNQVIIACEGRLLTIFSFEETNQNGSLGVESEDPSNNTRLFATLESKGLYGGWEEDTLGRPVPTIFCGEEILLRAFRKVSREPIGSRKAYFLIGHGEMNLSSWNETRGLSEMKNFFDGLDLESKEFMLGSGQSVPEDADLVVIASPQVRLSEEEAFVLQGYLSDRRGSMLLMLDPVRGLEDHGLTSLLRLWGLSCDDMRLVEPSVEKSNLAPYATLSFNRNEMHPIVSYLAKHDIPLWLFPQASRGRPVFTRTGQASERVTVTTLLNSSQASWAEHDWRLPGIVDNPNRRSEPLNEAGPVPFLAAVERKVRSKHGIDIPGGKLLAVGNSSLFCNLGLSQNGNRTLFSNATHWLLDENEFLDVPPKPIRRYEMSLDATEYRSLLYHLGIVPALVALIGFSRRVLRRDS